MRKPADLALQPLRSALEWKKQATQLKRVAGALRTEIGAAELLGLDAKELGALREALPVLASMAEACEKACKAREQQDKAIAKRETEAARLFQSSLGGLTSIRDKVALVASVTAYQLRSIHDLADLDYFTKEALGSIYYQAARSNDALPDVVAAINTKFQKNAPKWIAENAALVLKLETNTALPDVSKHRDHQRSS